MASEKPFIIVPMAGRGSRFAEAGYDLPKPFLPVNGEPMFVTVGDNLCNSLGVYEVRFVAMKAHEVLAWVCLNGSNTFCNSYDVVPLDAPTEGAACTVLHAIKPEDMSRPIIIANCDQVIEVSAAQAHEVFSADATVLTVEKTDPAHSFCRCDTDDATVLEVAEKKVISTHANVGVYCFRDARTFVNAVHRMIAANDRYNYEFYVAPALNYVIGDGKTVKRIGIDGYISLGHPAAYRDWHSTAGGCVA